MSVPMNLIKSDMKSMDLKALSHRPGDYSWRLGGDSSLRDVAMTSPGDYPGLRGVAGN